MHRSIVNLFAALIVGFSFAADALAEPKSYSETFRVDALTAIGKVMAIEPRGKAKPLKAEELRMLQDIRNGNLEAWSTADVALVVAGIADGEDANNYRQQVEQITEQAREAVMGAKTEEQQAKKLAKFLRNEPMKAGYISGQYDLKVLLDTGHYNCVSSAVLYDMIARRLGMKVEGVNIPHHVFCRFADFDIEPTSGRVYPSDIREERVRKKRTDKDDEKGSLYADQLFRETSNRSLMSEPYYDEGCKLAKEKKYDRALVSFLKACVLEPENVDAARGVNNSISNWFDEQVKNGQAKQAAAIVKMYRELLRDTAAAEKLQKKLKSGKRAA